MQKFLALALVATLSAGCTAAAHPWAPRHQPIPGQAGAQTAAVNAIRPTGQVAAKSNPKVEILVTLTGTITGRIEKSNGDVGAVALTTADGDQTVYLTEKTALAWDPRIKAIRAPNAKLDLKAGTRVEVLAAEEKNTGWGPATWLRAKSVVILVGAE